MIKVASIVLFCGLAAASQAHFPATFEEDVASSPTDSCAGYSGSEFSHCLPDYKYEPFSQYIERVAEPDYRFASDEAYKKFNNIKYGVRIHWGIYSIVDTWGGPEAGHESWPFLQYNMTFRNEYEQLYKTWNPKDWSAKNWFNLFDDAGFRMFAFTTKHHEGFSMYDTKTKVSECYDWVKGQPYECNHSYSIMDTPFGRDVTKEIVDEARTRTNMTVDLYFSHPDWHDTDFRPYGDHPVQVPSSCQLLRTFAPGSGEECQEGWSGPILADPTVESTDRMMGRHREQMRELLTQYGKVDMISLDIQLGPAVWPQLRDTIKEMRKIQPDVMFRARGIGNYGDYYTPEGFVPGDKSNSDVPWFVIYPLGGPFSYDPVASRYKSPRWIAENLVDSIAKGGNFMVGIGPDTDGNFHPNAVAAVKAAGKWVHAHSEGIFDTEARNVNWHETDPHQKNETRIWFTKSNVVAEQFFTYAHQWPVSNKLVINTLKPTEHTKVSFMNKPDIKLTWSNADTGMVVTIPSDVTPQDVDIENIGIFGFKLTSVQEIQQSQ